MFIGRANHEAPSIAPGFVVPNRVPTNRRIPGKLLVDSVERREGQRPAINSKKFPQRLARV